jgi:anti-sigma factor RsiW
MTTCQDLEPLFAPYVDGEATADQRAAIEEHLVRCPSCRACAEAEAQAREMITARRDRLLTPAPARLHQKCAALAQQQVLEAQAAARTSGAAGARSVTPPAAGLARQAPPLWRRHWAPLSLAATVMLVVAAVFAYSSFTNRGTALAAQLAADHVRCTGIVGDHAPGDAAASKATWKQRLGWPVEVPTFGASDDLQFVQLRRCLHDHDVNMAHILYRRRGRLLSLFVMPEHEPDHDALMVQGQRTVIWSQGGRTYAVVGANSPAELQELADRFSRALP